MELLIIQFALASCALSFGLLAILYWLFLAVSRKRGPSLLTGDTWADLIPPAFFTLICIISLVALTVVSV